VAEDARMMVLVDTTVWIDFFANRPDAHVNRLRALIVNDEDLCVCGVILAETLQGIRSDAEYHKTKNYFSDLIFFQMSQTTFLLAADLYRALRKKGVTVRKPVDCMIAAVAMEHGLWLLHNDRDFDNIAKHSNLKILDVAS
jgi:predicted nucleic acid-binding protein